MSGETSVGSKVRALADVIAREADRNADFAERLNAVLGGASSAPAAGGKSVANARRRRNRGALDPFKAYSAGEPALRESLAQLDVEALKDIIAEHGMDQAK